MNKKNILFINDWMYGGGAERSMAILINELAKTKEYNITLLMLEDKISYKLDNSIDIISFRKSYKFGSISKLYTLFTDSFRLNAIVQQNNIDVVLSFQHRSNFINILTKKFFNHTYKCIGSERVYTKAYFEKDKLTNQFFNFMVKWLYNKANNITCNAQDIKNGLVKFYNVEEKKIKVIENSYDVDKILQLSKEEIDKEDKYIFESKKQVIINIGRLSEQKGQKYLIEAFAKLKNKEDYLLIILGEGELLEDLQLLANKLDVNKYIYFLGHKSNPYKYLARSDIFVFPSLYEGYPNALAEAMIFDLKIISFDFKSGAKDIIGNNEYGILVDMYDIDNLAKNIELKEYDKKKKELNRLLYLLKSYRDIIDEN